MASRTYLLPVRTILFLATALAIAVPVRAGDDLVALSDDFGDAATLSQWKRVYAVEGWGANQLELQDINATQPGAMVMMPYTSTWYNDYRGELTFKDVQGDFVVTTDVTVTRRGGGGAPRSQYSLGGIMLRAPRNITPATWRPGGEYYLFLSLGAGDHVATFQYEVKSTIASNSQLILSPAAGGHAQIQWVRVGSYFIALRNDGSGWRVHNRYQRADMPPTLQVGMTVYTDYPTASMFAPQVHNATVIHSGFPDLVAAFDYFRFERPRLPPSLLNANFMDVIAVPDSALLAAFGANATANLPSIVTPPAPVTAARGTTATFSVTAAGEAPLRYQWRKNGADIASATSSSLRLDNVQLGDAGLYSVVVSNPAGSAASGEVSLTVSAPRRRAARP